MINVLPNTVKAVQILCEHAGKLATGDGEIRYVSVKELKRALALQETISGFIVPVPEISGPIWNATLAKICKVQDADNEFLYELFEDYIEISHMRSWYYENLGKYILRTYMLPLKRFCKSVGKEIIFDFGNVEMQYDLMKNMISSHSLKKAGLSLAVHKENGNIEKELGFSSDDYVIKKGVLKKVSKKTKPNILLIKPTRGVMERFIQGEIKARPNRLETPALSSAIESTYYVDMLTEMGHSFDVTDEIHLPKDDELKKYENILICESCLFTEKEKKRIDKLKKYGVKINNNQLLYIPKKEKTNGRNSKTSKIYGYVRSGITPRG